jgi:xanthine dehydrogenase accessory factor
MKEILADLDRWQAQDEEIALATLVRVRGSAPRPPGARLCVTRRGRMAGSVSGGCVENDVFERAVRVLERGEPALASYGIADEWAVEVGLSCGGSIEVLIEPFVACEAWRALRQAVERERPSAWAIGLAPAGLLGRKLALLADGPPVGSIDPGLDEGVVDAARHLLPEGGTRVLELPGPGGEASVFLEAFAPPLRLFIVGATHAAIFLCRLAKELGFRVTVIDPRSPFATRERFPGADAVHRAWPDQALGAAGLDAYCYVVALTHDFKFDVPTLTRALRSGARYVGALGSRRTHERRKQRLREAGLTEADLARIRAPIGLDLGGSRPEEIALAILAEMLAVRYGRDGGALQEKRTTIHERD